MKSFLVLGMLAGCLPAQVSMVDAEAAQVAGLRGDAIDVIPFVQHPYSQSYDWLIAEATSPDSSSTMPTYASCTQTWAHLVFSTAWTCNPFDVGFGSCREVYVQVDSNALGNATCTYNPPGTSYDFSVGVHVGT